MESEEKYLTIQKSRFLEETTVSNEVIVIVILCVCSVITIGVLIYCCLKKKRQTQKIDFEVFTNENVSAKDTKPESVNATNEVPMILEK